MRSTEQCEEKGGVHVRRIRCERGCNGRSMYGEDIESVIWQIEEMKV